MATPEPSELAGAAVSEIYLAVAAARPLARVAGLHVDSIRIVAQGPHGEEERPSWNLQMRFNEADTSVELAGTTSGSKQVGELPTGGALFDELSVTVLNGLSKRTSKKLRASGIETIGQLADVGDRGLVDLARKLRFPSAVEFRTKARLTRGFVPQLPMSEADTLSLFELAQLSSADLQRRFGSRALNSPSAAVLSDYLKLLAVAIHSKVLRDLTLRHLRIALERSEDT